MNGLNLSNIQDAKLGSTQVSALYYGNTKLWPLETFYYKDWSKYEKQYFTVEVLEDSCAIRLLRYGKSSSPCPAFTFEYSIDGGTWVSKSYNELTSYTYYTTISNLNAGQKVRIRVNREAWGKSDSWSYSRGDSLYFTKQVRLSGNINSLIRGANFYKNYNCKDINTCNFMNSLFYCNDSSLIANITDVSKLYIPAYSFAPQGSYTEDGATIYTNRYQFYKMFENCSFPKAPYLDIYVNSNEYFMYSNMFRNATTLSNVDHISIDSPIVSANPSYYGFQAMFYGCSSLTKSPKMTFYGSTTRTFESMFGGCSSLTDLEINLFNINDNSFNSWVDDTTNLTQIKINSKHISTNSSNLKSSKTLVSSKYYDPYYFTIESLEDNNVISFKPMSSYMLNGWSLYKNGTFIKTQYLGSTTVELATLNKGDILQIVNGSSSDVSFYTNSSQATLEYCARFITTGKFNVSGEINSLFRRSSNFNTSTTSIGGYGLTGFFSNSKVVDARNLKFDCITLGTYSLYMMFAKCEYLERAPRFIECLYDDNHSLDYMFAYCTSLYEGPEILIDILQSSSASSRLHNIFYNCANLEYVAMRFITDSMSDTTNQYGMVDWLTGTTPSKLTINSNLWSASSGMAELSSYSNSKIPEGATLIDYKIIKQQ